MQMLTKNEFKKELLNKYEVSHGLSNDIIDGMISRGFIPSVTNEIGDKTYNIDYYIENEDIFNNRLTEYKNTRGYYTDSELKIALVDRDSSFNSVPLNVFNNLAKRGLIKKDYFYEVRRNEVYLFASNLIYDIEALKAAITELNEQLEAEEAEELAFLNNDENVVDENDDNLSEEETQKTQDENELEEDDWEDDDYDEQLEKKQKAKKKAQERKKREDALRKEEALKKEAELNSEPSVSATPNFASAEHTIEEKTESTHTGINSEFSQTEKDTADSIYKEDSKQKAPETTVTPSQSEGKEAYSSSKSSGEQSYASLDRETHKTNEYPKTTNAEEHKPVEPSSASNSDNPTGNPNKTIEYSASQSSDAKNNKSHDNSVSENQSNIIKEEVEQKKEYEEERRKANENIKTEEKPKLRNDDGTFSFTGTEIGKTEPNSSIDNKSTPVNDGNSSSVFHSDRESQKSSVNDSFTGHKEKETYAPESKSSSEILKDEEKAVFHESEKTAPKTPSSSEFTPSVDKQESSSAQPKSYSGDSRNNVPADSEEQKKKDAENRREAEAKSENQQKKNTVSKDGQGYAFTGTSVGRTEKKSDDKKEYSDSSANDSKYLNTAEKSKSSYPYKINIPLADGSYMTFETTQSQKDVSYNDPYDNFTVRTQEAYVASQTVLSQKALDEIVASVAQHSDDNDFKVTLVKTDNEGDQKKSEIYNSKKPETFIGDISETYKRGNRVDKLPDFTPTQQVNDSKVLFAVGIKNGGEIKGDTYIPPAVPTIHPRVFDELAKQGIEYVSVNGVKVKTETLTEISRNNFSVIENTNEYQNAAVAKELINKATSFVSNTSAKSIFEHDSFSSDNIKKAENIISKSIDEEKRVNDKFSLSHVKDCPEFVPAYLREKYIDTKPQNNQSSFNSKIETTRNISPKRTIGYATDLTSYGSNSANPLDNYGAKLDNESAGTTRTRVLAMPAFMIKEEAKATLVGSSAEVIDAPHVNIDYSRPEVVEMYASALEVKYPELAKELRTVSREINGEIATVITAQQNGTKPIVDGAQMINNPAYYIAGKARYAEFVASSIEQKLPEQAKTIRTLSKEINGEIADVYANNTITDGKILVSNPDVYIKGHAADAKAIADAIKNHYPETSQKIRKLSDKLNKSENNTFERSISQAQELLSNVHVIKGHAKEVESIAANIEIEHPDIAKQLREASKFQNGKAAEIYEKASILGRKVNTALPTVSTPLNAPPLIKGDARSIISRENYGSETFKSETKYYKRTDFNDGAIKKGLFIKGTQPDIDKRHKFKSLSADNIKSDVRMMTITEKDKLGRKHLSVATFNSDGSINITWNADKKNSSVTLLGYASDINSFDNTELKSALASRGKLAKAGIRNRKLEEVHFITSDNAHFYVNPEWVKSTRKKQNVKFEKAKDADAITRQFINSADRFYKVYASGMWESDIEPEYDKYGLAGDGTVVKGLRSVEQLKAQKSDNLSGVAQNIMWHIMPMQGLNQTYLGSGFRYLFGRGSALWTLTSVGAALNAKDELRALNRKAIADLGRSKTQLTKNGRVYSFKSGKDRRALAKEIEQLSMSSLGCNITRLTDTTLKKALVEGKFGTKALTDEQRKLISATLQLRGITEGTLSTLVASEYLNKLNINPFAGGLSAENKKFLDSIGFNNVSIDKISQSTVDEILQYCKDNNIVIPADLASLLERAGKFNYANLNTKEGLESLLNEISLAGENMKFDSVLKGVKISELSDKQIKELLKTLSADNALKPLLEETLKLRELLEKKSSLKRAAGQLKNIASFWARKAMFKFRGQALGDGMYAIYSAYRTVNTAVRIAAVLRSTHKTNQALFRKWLADGKPNSLRRKLYNSKYYKKKFAKQDAKALKKLNKEKDKALKERIKQRKKLERRKRNPIRKVKNRIAKRMPKGLSKVGRGIKKAVGAIFKPYKVISGFINKAKEAVLKKIIIPAVKYILIFIGAIVLLQIIFGLADAGLEGIYSIIYFKDNDSVSEDINGENELTTEQSLTNNTVELCINLDSAFKYYIEKYYDEDTVIDAVKDSIKEENEDELKQFYDPNSNEYLKLKRLGTTLNNIQTGVYYTYYNGDGEEIGFKSNAKDITAMADAWIGEDFHAKGLYKSYVEKLWNYSHMVAYAPRNISDTLSYATSRADIDDKEVYGDNRYVYACSSNKESSECYENAYDYKCNNSGANVYDSSKNIRTDIKNGNDKTSGKVEYAYTSSTSSNITKYNIKNGIVEYSAIGCSQHKMTYHKSATSKDITDKILANGTPTKNSSGVWGYITASSNVGKNNISLPNGQNASIRFYSNGDNSALAAPSGCTNWKYIDTAYKKTDGTVVACRAYYCAGCHSGCSESSSVSATMPTQKIAHHAGSGATTIGGETYYRLNSINGCSEKETKYHSSSSMTTNGKTYNHVLGTNHIGCNNYGSFVVSTKHSSSSKEYCFTGYCTKITSNQTCTWKLSTYRALNGTYYAVINNPLIKEKINVRGQNHDAYRADKVQLKTYAAAPTGWTTIETNYVKFNDRDFECSSATVNGVRYVWDIYPKDYNRTFGTVNLTCYQTPCKGHTVTNTTTTNTTYYYCKGHEHCKGYLASDPHNISVNYCKGYCPGHTLEHYCTGHVDLNIAVVTLYLEDKNDLAYLGVPKEVDSEEKEINNIVDSLTGNEESHTLEVQTPKAGTDYLYDNVFLSSKFDRFDYEKFPLPGMSIINDISLDLKGHSVSDPGNFGNPLDTLRWTPDFVNDKVDKSATGKKTLNDVISALYSTFSIHGVWKDRNDGATGNFDGTAISVDAFNIKGDYSKFGKHHYFDGWFEYDGSGKIEWAGDIGHQTPRDTGAYSRATESLGEDWYEAYGLSFPGAYNSRPDDKEIDRILKYITQCCSSTVNGKPQRIVTAKKLLDEIGNTYSGSGIDFAKTWYQNFYKSVHGSENTIVNAAYNDSKGFSSNYTYQAKVFRRSLGVKSISDSYGNVDNVICGLSAGDMIGAGDEVYIVLYNDTSASETSDGEARGIDKGHVIVATVNGAESSSGNDEIHLFSFTTEYISKKSDLFWVYKCT